jgi:glycosyltransferase involved in cell wall biosynthesis
MTELAVTVVVPTYRRSDRLPRLIAAMEAQTLPSDRFEVVVVDNGSNDDTSAVLEQLAAATTVQLRPLVITENRGPARARNLGWRSAAAPVVAFTDDDCVPEPQWLEWGLRTICADPSVGVVQGCTLKPLGSYGYTRWTSFREITSPSPWFEGCNLFFRREALEAGGGFDEGIVFGGEDSVAGWSVVAAGWRRDFERAAVVRHDLGERPFGWHLAMAWKEGDLLGVVARYPQMRAMFWRPWALRPLNVAFAAGVVGTVVALWRRPALLLWLPWVLLRRPPLGTRHWFRYLGERFLHDSAVFAGMKAGAIKHRQAVL